MNKDILFKNQKNKISKENSSNTIYIQKGSQSIIINDSGIVINSEPKKIMII